MTKYTFPEDAAWSASFNRTAVPKKLLESSSDAEYLAFAGLDIGYIGGPKVNGSRISPR